MIRISMSRLTCPWATVTWCSAVIVTDTVGMSIEFCRTPEIAEPYFVSGEENVVRLQVPVAYLFVVQIGDGRYQASYLGVYSRCILILIRWRKVVT
jgi:hypothetical protein